MTSLRSMPKNAEPGDEGGVRGPALTKHQRKIEIQRAYRKTAAGKAAYQRYNRSEAKKSADQRYDKSFEGRMIRRMWDNQPSIRRKKAILQQIRRQNGR